MSDVPAHLRYTAEHEWAELTGELTVRVGITDYAQNSLGDIVFVSVHASDGVLASGDIFGEVESTKSVSDLYAPVAGRVTRHNDELAATPELVNSDPYGGGWVAELTVEDAGVLAGLLDADAYRALIES
jgi:glycine cleavage system H protein